VLQRRFGMTLDAIGSLRDVGSRACDQLFCLGWQRTVGEHELAERVERSLDGGCEFPTFADNILDAGGYIDSDMAFSPSAPKSSTEPRFPSRITHVTWGTELSDASNTFRRRQSANSYRRNHRPTDLSAGSVGDPQREVTLQND
jgi:hypothetical protein